MTEQVRDRIYPALMRTVQEREATLESSRGGEKERWETDTQGERDGRQRYIERAYIIENG